MEQILDQLLGPQALLVFTLFVIFAGWRGWWVWGKDYDKLEREKNEWKDAALSGIKAAEKVLEHTEAS